MRRFYLGGLLAALVAGCAPTEEMAQELDPASEQQGIVGGTNDYGDPEVFMLMMEFNNGSQAGCTATLIARRTLLTAAHCVDPRMNNATSIQIWAMNKADVNTAGYGDMIRVTETLMHSGWNPLIGSYENDIAMALLETAPNVTTPKPWNTSNIGTFTGRPLRAVGYGTTGAGSGSGVKRTVGLTFRQLSSSHIYLGDGVGKGVCHGDSGGPSFHTFSDGVERQVGVHSYTSNAACTDGADIRVDAYASFINNWLTLKEGPQCGHDRRCKIGCTPVDQDCACVADGACTAQCAFLDEDPDCPKDCVANGVCSTLPCPVADVDCVAEGQKCASELLCQSRLCISDPQHPDFYCSRQCPAGGSCPTGMVCPSGGGTCQFAALPVAGLGAACTVGKTFCVGGTVCTGPQGSFTSCMRRCSGPGDCPEGEPCEAGQNGFNYCRPPTRPPIYLTRNRTEGAVAASCTQVPVAPAGLALLLTAGMLRRRRRS